VDCNRALCRLVERRKEEILGQPQSFLHLPEDLVNGQSPNYKKHRMIQYEVALEDRLFSKSGKIVPVEIRGTRIRINGRDHIMGVFRDITERMQSEEMLRQSERKFRDLADLLPQVVFELDLQGRLTYVNRFAFDLFGYSKTDLEEGLDALDMIAPCDRDRAAANMSKAMREGIQTGFDYTAVRRNGEEFPVIIYSTPIHSNGNIIGLRGIIVDFTERKRSLERTQKALEATIHAIAITVETRDPYTAGHQRRVADLSRAIAAEMGLTNSQIDSLYMAGIIHDLGKISIPSEILSKPARLAEIEFELIKVHPQSGYDILKDIEFPWPVARIIIEHHERMNGSGYPNRLTGDKLLIESRILAVADVVESMASHRPYRPALGLDAAFEEISKNKGILYDPEAVDACIRLFAEKNYKMID
jgi:PAS domain S-box-containing protein